MNYTAFILSFMLCPIIIKGLLEVRNLISTEQFYCKMILRLDLFTLTFWRSLVVHLLCSVKLLWIIKRHL